MTWPGGGVGGGGRGGGDPAQAKWEGTWGTGRREGGVEWGWGRRGTQRGLDSGWEPSVHVGGREGLGEQL